MREAVIIAAVIFASCMFAIGAFLAAQWVDPDWRTMPPDPKADKPLPYSPPRIQPLFAPVAFESNPATFQNFAADSADENGAWGPTA
jgi:hypothetical protein